MTLTLRLNLPGLAVGNRRIALCSTLTPCIEPVRCCANHVIGSIALTWQPILKGLNVATLEVNGDNVVLELGRLEGVEAMHIHTISAPLAAVQSVEGVDDPWSDLRGVKEVGTEIPGKTMVGTRRGEGFKDFCAVHKKGPAVIVTFDPAVSEYNRWVVSGDISDVPAELKR